MVSKMPDGGNIVALRGIPTTIDNMRVEGFEAAIEGSGIKVPAMEHGIRNRDDSFTVMQHFVSKYPQIALAIEMRAVGLTSNAPVAGSFTIGSVLVTPENAAQFYFENSPF